MANEIRFNRTANSMLQNEINISIIYHYLRDVKSTYRAEISKQLNISAPAVSRAVEVLIEQGYVIETEKRKTPSGKKASLLMPNTTKGFIIGVDLLKEHMRIGLFNYLGEMLDSYSGRDLSKSTDIVSDLSEEIDAFLDAIQQKQTFPADQYMKIDALCIGVPAVVDSVTGELLSAVLFSNLQNVNLKTSLSSRYNIPVFIENDVNLSALGEKNAGRGKNYSNLAFIEVSSGIGTGIVIDGRLFRGSHHFSGEIGHAVIGTENIGVTYRNKGYLEQHASTESISAMAKIAMEQGRETLLYELTQNDVNRITPALVCRAAQEHDQVAVEILTRVSRMLSVAIIHLILIIDPEIVVLGGTICTLPGIDDLLLNPIREAVESSLPYDPPHIALSSLDEDAALFGASFLAAESLILGKYPYRI